MLIAIVWCIVSASAEITGHQQLGRRFFLVWLSVLEFASLIDTPLSLASVMENHAKCLSIEMTSAIHSLYLNQRSTGWMGTWDGALIAVAKCCSCVLS